MAIGRYYSVLLDGATDGATDGPHEEQGQWKGRTQRHVPRSLLRIAAMSTLESAASGKQPDIEEDGSGDLLPGQRVHVAVRNIPLQCEQFIAVSKGNDSVLKSVSLLKSVLASCGE